jgi:hypothetical protein
MRGTEKKNIPNITVKNTASAANSRFVEKLQNLGMF